MPGRKFAQANSGYRYGFNGKENDKDAGEGIQDYGMRIYSERLGKFLSVDPLTKSYPWYTPYQFAGNKPIIAVDLDGKEELLRVNFYNQQGSNYLTVFIPLSSKRTENFLTDLWADITGNEKARNWESGKKDRFTGTSAHMDSKEWQDYASGNIFKNSQRYKAPFTGQLTIDINKPGSQFTYTLSYKRNLTHDEKFKAYASEATKTNLIEVGYLISAGLSKAGTFYSYAGVIGSVFLGPEVGAFGLTAGSTMGKIADGMDLGLDYIRKDYSLANKKLLLFGTFAILDVGLGKAGKLAPSEQQKLDVIGATLNYGSGEIKDNLTSKPDDKIRLRKKDLINRAMNFLIYM